MGSSPTGPTTPNGGVVRTNIAVIKSRDPRVREAVRNTLNSLGLFWEEVSEPDPIKHMVSIFPEEAELVPITTPSIFIGSTALAYFQGEKVENKMSPPKPAGFLELNRKKSPFFGMKYTFDCERLSRTNPVFRKESNILIGYDLFRTIAYLARGAELSLGVREIKTRDNKLDLNAVAELRGAPVSVPAVDVHAKLLLSSILFLFRIEGLPLVLKRLSPPGKRGALAISVPVLKLGKPRSLLEKMKSIFRKKELWIEKIWKINNPMAFFTGRGWDYTPSEVTELLLSIEENGHEVGLLASPKASISHEAILDEYRELAEALKRGDLGIRFRGIESTFSDALEAASFVKAKYVIIGDPLHGFGYFFGISKPYKIDSLWNFPLIGKVRREQYVPILVDEVAKRGSFSTVEALTKQAILSIIREAESKGVWISTPSKILERLERIYAVRANFRYDRKYLEGKLIAQSPIKDFQIVAVNPEGRETVVEVELESNKGMEINLRI